MFMFHHVPAWWCGVHVYLYGVTSDHTKKFVIIFHIYKIVIKRTEILQCLNHGGSY